MTGRRELVHIQPDLCDHDFRHAEIDTGDRHEPGQRFNERVKGHLNRLAVLKNQSLQMVKMIHLGPEQEPVMFEDRTAGRLLELRDLLP
jgi:hypothetical protein